MGEKTKKIVKTSDSKSLAAPLLEVGLRDILERNYAVSEGSCPWCEEADYPVDEHGNKIEPGDYETEADQWHLDHADDCAVTYIEKLLKGEYEFIHPQSPQR